MKPAQNILILDTATEESVVALALSEKLVSATKKQHFLQSRFLFSSIDTLCMENHITSNMLSFVAVGIGPGSYTGIRVAVAAAKGVSYALKVPLIGFCTLTGFVPGREGTFLSVIDAKMGGVYCLGGVQKHNICTFDARPELLSITAFEKRLSQIEYIVTPSWKQIQERLTTQTVSATVLEKEISVEALYHEVYKAICAKKWIDEGQLDLLYLRQAVASTIYQN